MGEVDGAGSGPPLAVTGGVRSLFSSLAHIFTQAQGEIEVATVLFSSTAVATANPFGQDAADSTYRQHVDATRAALVNLTKGLGEIASAIQNAGAVFSSLEQEVAKSMATSAPGE